MTRINSPPLTLLRIYIHDSPYNNAASLFDSSGPSSEGGKTLYIAFPDGAPFVYVSIGTEPGQPAGGEGRSLRRVVIDVSSFITLRWLSTLTEHRASRKLSQNLEPDTPFNRRPFTPNLSRHSSH